jgi:MurNAc alpha-1-phosphate uridylyltransferase
MKAMILAAGRGQRLRPYTDSTPKPLLKAGKFLLIEYIIHALVKAGITEIIINIAHLAEQFPARLGNGHQYGVNITYSPEQEGALETAGGIINALPLLGDEPFLIVNGDVWTDYDYQGLVQKSLSPDRMCHLVMINNPVHNTLGDFALTAGLIEPEGELKYTYSGIGVYHPNLFSGLAVQRLALKPILLKAIANEQISGELYQGDWSDIGTIERLESLATNLNT